MVESKTVNIKQMLHRLVKDFCAGWAGGKPKGSKRPVKLTPGPPISDYVIQDRRGPTNLVTYGEIKAPYIIDVSIAEARALEGLQKQRSAKRPRRVYQLRGWRKMILNPYELVGLNGGALSGRISEPAECKFAYVHTVPDWDCSCGYYAVFNRVSIAEYSGDVWVEVVAMGPTIICGVNGTELGFRCRQYRVEALYVDEEKNKFRPALRRLYGVPVYVLPSAGITPPARLGRALKADADRLEAWYNSNAFRKHVVSDAGIVWPGPQA